MYEDSFLEMEYEDRFEVDDFEMFNQNEADDYRHEFDGDDEDDFVDWEDQFDERCSWDQVD